MNGSFKYILIINSQILRNRPEVKQPDSESILVPKLVHLKFANLQKHTYSKNFNLMLQEDNYYCLQKTDSSWGQGLPTIDNENNTKVNCERGVNCVLL